MKHIIMSLYGARLDSDVRLGGGTDDTDILQKALDEGIEGGVHIVLDGAALISKKLRIHSNTVLECPAKNCGVFLAPHSDCCMVTNADPSRSEITNDSITLLGGTYNQNSRAQVHDRPAQPDDEVLGTWVFGMCFCGVSNLTIRNVTILNQRTFAATFICWRNVTVENMNIERTFRDPYQNQDGLHFFGPGRFLNIKNIYGNSGDDFIALAPDELDGVSAIEDVRIDGVMLDDADQGIRLLSKGTGRLDRVFISNVCGTCASYGFYINPWFEGRGGDYGHIVIENVDIKPIKPVYDYRKPVLFSIGGNIEDLQLKNITHYSTAWGHDFMDIGSEYMGHNRAPESQPTHVKLLRLEGVTFKELPGAVKREHMINDYGETERLIVSNVYPENTEI